jgi:hypothetical protein
LGARDAAEHAQLVGQLLAVLWASATAARHLDEIEYRRERATGGIWICELCELKTRSLEADVGVNVAVEVI